MSDICWAGNAKQKTAPCGQVAVIGVTFKFGDVFISTNNVQGFALEHVIVEELPLPLPFVSAFACTRKPTGFPSSGVGLWHGLKF